MKQTFSCFQCKRACTCSGLRKTPKSRSSCRRGKHFCFSNFHCTCYNSLDKNTGKITNMGIINQLVLIVPLWVSCTQRKLNLQHEKCTLFECQHI